MRSRWQNIWEGKVPTASEFGGRSQFGPKPNSAPKTQKVPDSGKRAAPSKGSEPSVPMTSVHPEAPDRLLEAFHYAAIDEEHRTLMSMLIKKVQSVKSRLTEACASLLTGFEVSSKIVEKYHIIDSSP